MMITTRLLCWPEAPLVISWNKDKKSSHQRGCESRRKYTACSQHLYWSLLLLVYLWYTLNRVFLQKILLFFNLKTLCRKMIIQKMKGWKTLMKIHSGVGWFAILLMFIWTFRFLDIIFSSALFTTFFSKHQLDSWSGWPPLPSCPLWRRSPPSSSRPSPCPCSTGSLRPCNKTDST